MSDLRKAAEMALEALDCLPWQASPIAVEATKALRTALAHQETTVENNSQNWKGMDGAVAWHLIDRHADNWADVGKMMDEWLKANQALSQPEQEPVACKHSRYSVDAHEQTGNCYDCGADGRMRFVVDAVNMSQERETAPPKREWKNLTGDDKHFLLANAWNKEQAFDGFMEAIDKFLEDKNT